MNEQYPLSRRNFLKLSSFAAVASVPTPLAVGNLLIRSTDSLRVGVLLPTSSIYPTLSEAFLAGLERYFQADHGITFHPQQVGSGLGTLAPAAHHLIESERVDVLVGVIGSRAAVLLADQLQRHHTLLVASDLGANVTHVDTQRPFLLYNSLNYWQSNWAMGTWTAENLGKRILVATNGYEGGYDALTAFRLALEKAGGEVVGLYLSEGQANLGDLIQETQPDAIFAAYAGQAAADFLNLAATVTDLPMVGSPFLLNETTVNLPSAQGVQVSSLAYPQTEIFAPLYAETLDPFAVLGYQAGLHLDSTRHKQNLLENSPLNFSLSLMVAQSGEIVALDTLPMVNVPQAENLLSQARLQSAYWNGYLVV